MSTNGTVDVKCALDNQADYPSIDIEEQSHQHIQNFIQHHAATADRALCDVSNNDSSMLSMPLALGILSPQQVYHYTSLKLTLGQASKIDDLSDKLRSQCESGTQIRFTCRQARR